MKQKAYYKKQKSISTKTPKKMPFFENEEGQDLI